MGFDQPSLAVDPQEVADPAANDLLVECPQTVSRSHEAQGLYESILEFALGASRPAESVQSVYRLQARRDFQNGAQHLQRYPPGRLRLARALAIAIDALIAAVAQWILGACAFFECFTRTLKHHHQTGTRLQQILEIAGAARHRVVNDEEQAHVMGVGILHRSRHRS